MAISEAARALLGQARSGVRPLTPGSDAPAAPAEPVTDRQQGFRDRAKREEERFRLATDGEFWLAVCFRTPDLPARFAARYGLTLDEGRYLPGPALAAAIGDRRKLSPAQKVKQMLAVRAQRAGDLTADMAPTPGPDPLAGVPETGDLAVDSLAELRAILAAMTAPPNQAPADVLDSPHWLTAYWPSREAKEEFLTASGLDVLGDKYIDGHQAATILGIINL